MSAVSEDRTDELLADTRPDSALSRDEVIARNLAAVESHFHNENPMNIDKAIAFYTEDMSWEAPARGQIDNDPQVIRGKYLDVFKSFDLHKTILLRRFATETSVFDDQIIYMTCTDDSLMPNLPHKVGDKISARLIHCFEMRDGRITREIGYELWRNKDSANDHDVIPEGAVVLEHDAPRPVDE